MGKSVVEGVRCDHLAFRAPHMDLQVWIQEGKQPLPRKVVITSRDVVDAPQFAVVVTTWNLNPKSTADMFSFSPPKAQRRSSSCPSAGPNLNERVRAPMNRTLKRSVCANSLPLLLLADMRPRGAVWPALRGRGVGPSSARQ